MLTRLVRLISTKTKEYIFAAIYAFGPYLTFLILWTMWVGAGKEGGGVAVLFANHSHGVF